MEYYLLVHLVIKNAYHTIFCKADINTQVNSVASRTQFIHYYDTYKEHVILN